MVIIWRNRRVNRILRTGVKSASDGHFFDFTSCAAPIRIHLRFIAILKLPFKFDRHDYPQQAGNGGEAIAGRFDQWAGAALDNEAAKNKGRRRMFQGHIDLDTATAVEASAIPDVLFERGLYWASGRSGVVNLVAAHKWFNLAALKGRTRCHPVAPRGRRDDVRTRDRHRPARGPSLDDRALRASADGDAAGGSFYPARSDLLDA